MSNVADLVSRFTQPVVPAIEALHRKLIMWEAHTKDPFM